MIRGKGKQKANDSKNEHYTYSRTMGKNKNSDSLTGTADVILEKKVDTPAGTEETAQWLARQLQGGDVVAFFGNLGSGKTFFIKALCRALGTVQEATSPSFTIINEYTTPDGQIVYHFDFYRLQGEGELVNLGLDDFFYSDSICLVEWADKIQAYLPDRHWQVNLKFIEGNPEGRFISIFKNFKQENDQRKR
ncbi:MAG: hypothetical protein Kow0042_27090 [Calditrichia bacterium]